MILGCLAVFCTLRRANPNRCRTNPIFSNFLGNCPTTVGICPTPVGICPTPVGICPTQVGICLTLCTSNPNLRYTYPNIFIFFGICPTQVGICPTHVGICPTRVGISRTKCVTNPNSCRTNPKKKNGICPIILDLFEWFGWKIWDLSNNFEETIFVGVSINISYKASTQSKRVIFP